MTFKIGDKVRVRWYLSEDGILIDDKDKLEEYELDSLYIDDVLNRRIVEIIAIEEDNYRHATIFKYENPITGITFGCYEEELEKVKIEDWKGELI